MAKFDVVVMRPLTMLGRYEGYGTLQDLQYVVIGISAHSMQGAGTAAIAEVWTLDKEAGVHRFASEYTVLGTLRGEVYRPWFNGNHP
jgi:hypothetical protein